MIESKADTEYVKELMEFWKDESPGLAPTSPLRRRRLAAPDMPDGDTEDDADDFENDRPIIRRERESMLPPRHDCMGQMNDEDEGLVDERANTPPASTPHYFMRSAHNDESTSTNNVYPQTSTRTAPSIQSTQPNTSMDSDLGPSRSGTNTTSGQPGRAATSRNGRPADDHASAHVLGGTPLSSPAPSPPPERSTEPENTISEPPESLQRGTKRQKSRGHKTGAAAKRPRQS
ncbi:hypothetical protein JVU11DRAFT_12731 [Chiua virens]|nr:hypothetical protein JVU11DRAFT_12731 [Chiua virens]